MAIVMIEDGMILDQVSKILIMSFGNRWATVGTNLSHWGWMKGLRGRLTLKNSWRELFERVSTIERGGSMELNLQEVKYRNCRGKCMEPPWKYWRLWNSNWNLIFQSIYGSQFWSSRCQYGAGGLMDQQSNWELGFQPLRCLSCIYMKNCQMFNMKVMYIKVHLQKTERSNMCFVHYNFMVGFVWCRIYSNLVI